MVTNTLVKPQESNLVAIQKNLDSLLKSKSQALPKNFNQTRFMQNCMTILLDVKDIEKMEPVSVARTMLKGAFLGLDFFRRECYAIPYGNSLNFQTDYKGDVKVAKLFSIRPIKEIFAKNVRKGDSFEEIIENGEQNINFKPVPFSTEPVIGSFAVVLFQDGGLAYETMSAEEIENVRKNYSKTANGPAWTKSPGEMYKKTVLRRLCKNIEIEFENQEQQEAFIEGADVNFDNAKPVEVKEVTTINKNQQTSPETSQGDQQSEGQQEGEGIPNPSLLDNLEE